MNFLKSNLECYLEHCKVFNYQIHPIQNGISSFNFYVKSDKDAFLIRCDLKRQVWQFEIDNTIIEAVSRNGVNTCGQVKDLYTIGNTLFSRRDYLPGMVFPSIVNCPYERMSDLGKQLAKIHLTNVPLEREGLYSFIYKKPVNHLKSLIRQIDSACKNKLLTDLVRSLCQEISSKLSVSLFKGPHVLLHGDVKPENLITQKNKTFIIDWEKSCTGPAIFDLSLAIFHLFSTEIGHDQFGAKIKIFLKAYCDEFGLNSTELSSLPDTITIAGLTFILMDIYKYILKSTLFDELNEQRRASYLLEYCYPKFLHFQRSKQKIYELLPIIVGEI